MALIWILVHRPTESRTKRVLNDSRNRSALQVYIESLPAGDAPDYESRTRAFATALQFLLDAGIKRKRAEQSLRLLVGEFQKESSYQIRYAALAHEEAGEWDEAIEKFELAAYLRDDWNRDDAAVLRDCAARVRAKRDKARAEGEE